MNENPWHIDDIARMQRERIQEEMREIRMVEAASRPHARRLNLAVRVVVQIYRAISKWLHPARRATQSVERRPQATLHAKPHTRA